MVLQALEELISSQNGKIYFHIPHVTRRIGLVAFFS
jgi:hypothetical protein